MAAAPMCDGPECDTWQRGPELPVGWVRTQEQGATKVEELLFCSYDCLLFYYAKRSSKETIL